MVFPEDPIGFVVSNNDRKVGTIIDGDSILFNYKMLEQKKARQWFALQKDAYRFTSKNTTRALDSANKEDFTNGYVDEIDIAKQSGYILKINDKYIYTNNPYPITQPIMDSNGNIIKPFLPCLYANNTTGYANSTQSLYWPDKIAGVDSTGILMGCLSMTGTKYRSIFNDNISDEIDQYFRREKNNAGVADNDKHELLFYVNEATNYLNGKYRFTTTDFEKSTILVPSIKQARPGDILVSFKGAQPHIGIIVYINTQVTNPDKRAGECTSFL